MNNFIYEIPTKVYFGNNQLDENLKKEIRNLGNKVLLVFGGGSIKKTRLYEKVINALENIEIFEFSGIEPNPRHTAINDAIKICREKNIDVILAVGGGSVIDSCKLIAAGYFYNGDCWDIVQKKVKVENALPIITILTTAATGSEMNGTAVISNLALNDKKSCKSPLMIPKVSFLEPTNTYSVNKFQTACGCFDILSHIMETYFSRNNGMYMLDKVLEGLMKTVVKYAETAYNEPDNYEARSNLMWASSWAINGFCRIDRQPNTWICHLIEHQLSAYYDITHGLGLAIITPRFFRHILNEKTVEKFYDFGVNVWEIDASLPKMEVAQKSIEKMEELFFEKLELTDSLSKLGIDDSDIVEIAEKICSKGAIESVIDINKNDIIEILKDCI